MRATNDRRFDDNITTWMELIRVKIGTFDYGARQIPLILIYSWPSILPDTSRIMNRLTCLICINTPPKTCKKTLLAYEVIRDLLLSRLARGAYGLVEYAIADVLLFSLSTYQCRTSAFW
jgi:hypothetical protein